MINADDNDVFALDKRQGNACGRVESGGFIAPGVDARLEGESRIAAS